MCADTARQVVCTVKPRPSVPFKAGLSWGRRRNGNVSLWRSSKLTSAAATAGPTTYDGKYRGKLPGLADLLAPSCSRKPPEQIDRAVGALLALALDLAVADQAIGVARGSCEYQGRGSAARPWCRIERA